MIEIAGEHVGFDVHTCTGFVGFKKGIFQGVGDDRKAKGVVFHIINGEADAVDGYASFGDDVLDVSFGYFDVEVGGVCKLFYFGDGTDGVPRVGRSVSWRVPCGLCL